MPGLIVLAAVVAVVVLPVLAGARPRDADDHPPSRQGRPMLLSRRRSVRPRLPLVVVRVASHGAIRIPRSFLGLSTEYWTLPIYERRPDLLLRVISLLTVPGDGPMVLRIGGDSADHTVWDIKPRVLPLWEFGLTEPWLRATAELVREARLRVILDLNLITGSPRQAAQIAQAAEATLPRRSIAGFEIGNEEDIYDRPYWLAYTGRVAARLLPHAFPATRYVSDFEAYSRMLQRVAPAVKLIGPAVSEPGTNLAWIAALVRTARARLAMVSAHRYEYSACAPRRSPAYPTIARVLNGASYGRIARSVAGAVRLVHAAGLPFRLTEVNSVTCSGRPGVSNTFATALWAPDVAFSLLRAGVDGINIHTRADAINAPFAIAPAGLVARPLLYGLIMAARALGPHGRLLRVHAQEAPGRRLDAWAVRTSGGMLHVLLVNRGMRSVEVLLDAPVRGRASVERLLGPSITSRWGVTLAGQHLDAYGRWTGRPAVDALSPRAGRYSLTMPRFSAALIVLHARSVRS